MEEVITAIYIVVFVFFLLAIIKFVKDSYSNWKVKHLNKILDGNKRKNGKSKKGEHY